MKIYLFGDSIFDNGSYVGEENSVSQILQKEIIKEIPGAEVVNYARDGFVTIDVLEQLAELEIEQGAYVFLSIGGNDLLNHADTFLDSQNKEVHQKLLKNIFLRYEAIRQKLLRIAPKVFFSNLYYPNFEEYSDLFAEKAPATISDFNSILDHEYGSNSILRLSDVMVHKDDFTNVIEPSVLGTMKIVDLIRSKINKCEKEVNSSKSATFKTLERYEKAGRRGANFCQNMHENPRFYKYYWHLFSRRSKFEGKEFFEKCQLSTYEMNRELESLEKLGEPYIIYNYCLPRQGSDTPFNRTKSKKWAPSYDDDTDIAMGKNGHK